MSSGTAFEIEQLKSCNVWSCAFLTVVKMLKILAYLLFIKQDDMVMGQFFTASFCIYAQKVYDLKI